MTKQTRLTIIKSQAKWRHTGFEISSSAESIGKRSHEENIISIGCNNEV